ncbi:MAG: nitroreductase family deazaflavin-dependent oxidoreductase [Chloroflexota bacterium]|nr:MAG: nitroreductase family deazaflavin-dependent oxidoreductase [Chloroflexota bacterium]
MTSEPVTRPRPSGALRVMLKVPVLLHQLGLAQQLAKRDILVVRTIGRRTGRERLSGLSYAVKGNTVYVIAGWGEHTDWYRNMQANPRVEVRIGTQRMPAHARTVTDPAERDLALQLMTRIDGSPPRFLRPLIARLGLDFDAELAEALANPSQLTVVALELAEPLTSQPTSRGMNRSTMLGLLFVATAVASLLLAIRRSRRKQR